MKRLIPFLALFSAMLGCSSDAPEKSAAQVPPVAGKAVAAATPTTPAAEQTKKPATPVASAAATPELAVDEPKATANPADGQTLDIDELFAKPKPKPVVVAKPEPPPKVEPVLPDVPKVASGPPPEMRLIGFSELDEVKALLSIEGKLNILALNDISQEGVELVGLEPPSITIKWGDTEKTIKLNEQAWVHVSSPTDTTGGIGHTMPLPPKPVPVALPGVKKFPPAPSGMRVPSSPPGPDPNKGPVRFPSPPPVPK